MYYTIIIILLIIICIILIYKLVKLKAKMLEPVKSQNPEHEVQAAIGGFIYEFELMMFEMREIIHMIFKNHNLLNYRLGVILLHDWRLAFYSVSII